MKTLNILTILLLILTLNSCTETIVVQPIPAPWILFDKLDNSSYVFTEDTVVKPIQVGRNVWQGDLLPMISSANGLKEIVITKNGVAVEIQKLLTDRVNYTFSESIPISLVNNFDTCEIVITATDLKNQVSLKKVKVLFSITGNRPGIPTASFGASKTVINVGEEVQFYNYSLNGTTYLWNFGDDSTSTALSPKHKYAKTGIFTVRLKTTNYLGEDTSVKSNYITVNVPSNRVADAEGNLYETITIGTHVWLKSNLRTLHYNNGESIKFESNDQQWQITSVPACCYLNNNTTMISSYGVIYNHYALTDSRGIAPVGWHVATQFDWFELQNYLIANGHNYDGTTSGNKIAKSLATSTGWASSSMQGTVGNTDYSSYRNKSGFSATPGGGRFYDYMGAYDPSATMSTWWTYNSDANDYGICYFVNFEDASLRTANLNKRNGYYVRCVKN